ncbi:DUF2975 domain-containing protein [Glycomyces sp. NPDC047010]|uniref:DUF2975 domain-containing protein n=1 Tax=Glycomyces sp. NPDC047010 TaxID=3155023 RepID=UPI0033EDB995
MNAFLILMLRLALVTAFLFGLFGQIFIAPNSLVDEIDFMYSSDFIPVLLTAAIVGVALVQVVLVAGWMLLDMIAADSIFSDRAFRWVDVIIAATIAATLLSAGVFCYVFVSDSNGTADEMALLGGLGSLLVCGAAGTSFAMLMVIMRGLLRKATQLQSEMAEVI